MMKRLLLPLLLLALASPAQALKLIVWDSEMQTKLGAGESSGNKFSLQLVRDYSGPVKVLFSQSADEKGRNAFSGLQSSYDGLLRNGQLSLLNADDDKAGSGVVLRAAASPGNGNVALGRFLQQYRLSLSTQTTGRGFGAPEPLPLLGRSGWGPEPRSEGRAQ